MTSSTPSEAPPGDADKITPENRLVIATLVIATFVVILNETIMNVALPRLMSDLNVTATTVQWLATAFMLSMSVVIPVTGYLLQRFTTRTVFVLAMALFSAGTLFAAIAPGFGFLLAARVVQASGTAVMLPLLMTTVLTLVPLKKRGQVMGTVSIVISVAPAIGPTISGVILNFLSWRFMFGLVLPIAIAALIFGARRLSNIGEPTRPSLDIPSVLLTVPAFGGVVYGLSQLGGESGGVGPILPLSVGAVCLTLFVLRQLQLQRNGSPLLDLRAFRYPMYTIATSLLMVGMMALFGGAILLPIYLQNILGIDTLGTGLLLLPGGLIMGLLAPTVGKWFDRVGPVPLTVTGTLLMMGALFGFSFLTTTTPLWAILCLHILLSIGLALLFTPAFTSGLNPLPPQLYSHGSAILSTLQQVAGAAGTALLVAVMATTAQSSAVTLPAAEAEIAGLRAAFLVATGLGAIAVILACFLRNQPPTTANGADDEGNASKEIPAAEHGAQQSA